MNGHGRPRALLWIGLGLCLVLAGLVSFYASSDPDGLERVGEDIGFIDAARDSAVADSPLSDYAVAGVGDERLSVGLAGAIGVLVTAVAAFGLFLGLARRARRSRQPAATG
jgi:cobalt/nickel transport system permease protein/cobalt/nickel transport protein